MRLSSLADYAIVVMSAIARHDGDVRFSATSLSDETGIPLPTAQKLMGRLAAAGLLESARGTGGGFALARPADQISLADIVEAVEGPIAMTACIEETRHECALEDNCRVRPHWSAVNGAIRGALAGVSLESLAHDLSPAVRPERSRGTVAGRERVSTSSHREEVYPERPPQAAAEGLDTNG
jgi:FeS assembly SUF system regulator